MHLYKMDVDERVPEIVSDLDMNTCYIEGGRIYFLSNSKDQWEGNKLYSMDLDGKNPQVAVSRILAVRFAEHWYFKASSRAIGPAITMDTVLFAVNRFIIETSIAVPISQPFSLLTVFSIFCIIHAIPP